VHVRAIDLFLAFARITLVSFGGVLFWCRRLIVVRNRWLGDPEFAEIVALAQLLPGVNGINLAVMVGYRFAGWKGAGAALGGFLSTPCIVVAVVGVLYQLYGAVPAVQHALAGMSCVAVGLLLSTAANLGKVLQRQWWPWLFAALAFTGVGIMRWPLLAVVAVLAPCAIFAAWKGER
jgi:chromate transporter